MEMTYFGVIICGALLVGIVIPLGIYLLTRRNTGMAEFDVFYQVMRKSRQAWREDDDLLQELSEAVSDLGQGQGNEIPRPVGDGEEQSVLDQ